MQVCLLCCFKVVVAVAVSVLQMTMGTVVVIMLEWLSFWSCIASSWVDLSALVSFTGPDSHKT